MQVWRFTDKKQLFSIANIYQAFLKLLLLIRKAKEKQGILHWFIPSTSKSTNQINQLSAHH